MLNNLRSKTSTQQPFGEKPNMKIADLYKLLG